MRPADEQWPDDPATQFVCIRQETTVGHTANYAFKKYNEAQFGADNGVTSHQVR